jgi:hypothetical protein
MLLLAALAALVAAEAGNDCYIETRRYLGPDGGPIVPGLHVVCVSTDEVGAHAEVYMDSSSTGRPHRVDIGTDDVAGALRRQICALDRHPKARLAEATVDDLVRAAYDEPRISDEHVDALLTGGQQCDSQKVACTAKDDCRAKLAAVPSASLPAEWGSEDQLACLADEHCGPLMECVVYDLIANRCSSEMAACGADRGGCRGIMEEQSHAPVYRGGTARPFPPASVCTTNPACSALRTCINTDASEADPGAQNRTLQRGLRKLFDADVRAGSIRFKLASPIGAAVGNGAATESEVAMACEHNLGLFTTTGRRILTDDDLDLSLGTPRTQQHQREAEDLSSLKLRELYTRTMADGRIDDRAIDDVMESENKKDAKKELLIQLLEQAETQAGTRDEGGGESGCEAEQGQKRQQQVVFGFTGGKWQWPPVRIGHEWHLPANKQHDALVLQTVSVRPVSPPPPTSAHIGCSLDINRRREYAWLLSGVL